MAETVKRKPGAARAALASLGGLPVSGQPASGSPPPKLSGSLSGVKFISGVPAEPDENAPKALPIISPNCSDLAPPSVVCKRFPDGESYCRLEKVAGLRGKQVTILHRLFPNPDQNLVTLLQMMYGARENGAAGVNLIIPYLPYARADKEWLEGEVVSARLLMRLLRESGAHRVITWDCHFLKKPGRFEFEGLEIDNLCAGPGLVAHLKAAKPNALVVSPDAGAKYLVGDTGLFMRKERGAYAEGSQAYRPVAKMEADFDMKGRHVVLIDDMIAGGGTMVRATQKCLESGAKSVSCAATHGMFLEGAMDKLHAAGAMRIVTTDTVPNPAASISIRPDIEKWMKV
ncbi:MAG: ribose-phosphate pyrophosphokinase [Candidatus Micrarchaeota archaeon]|nr:ribose-phosphate pyrophosphokinase [Candidatus Micrarchaeota archaeon]